MGVYWKANQSICFVLTQMFADRQRWNWQKLKSEHKIGKKWQSDTDLVGFSNIGHSHFFGKSRWYSRFLA